MKVISFWIILSIACLSYFTQATDYSEDDIYSSVENTPITCTSGLRLLNLRSGFYLHSHDLNYGSGSGQQSVTGYGEHDHDYNSIWTIKEAEMPGPNGEDQIAPCLTGKKIKCDDIIRLEHMNTRKNLHSHSAFDSPVSGRQEVSSFGNDGDGDGGDNWVVECESDDVGGYVFGKTNFYLKHRDTGLYLYTDTNSKYTDYNCRRCPIIGQSEISCARGKTKNALWKVHSGFFFPELEEDSITDIDDSEY